MTQPNTVRPRVESLEDRTMMAFDAFLKIEGVPGEVATKGQKGSFEIESWSWGTSNPTGSIFDDLHIIKLADKASPQLAKVAATGEHIKKAVLFVRKSGGGREDYYKVTMSDLLISSFQQKFDLPPVESLSINFSKITFVYQSHEDRKPTKIVNPASDATGLDLNRDNTPDPLFFAYGEIGDRTRDLVQDLFIPGDLNGDMRIDNPPLIDLNGDGARDDVPPGFDGDGSGSPDLVLPVDLNTDGVPDLMLNVDIDDGRVDTFIFADLDQDGKADMLVAVCACDHL